jgi:hypothetical protein
MSARFSPAVEAALDAAGWYPGRRLDEDTLAGIRRAVARYEGPFGGTAAYHPAVDRALEEFGGLVIGTDRPGDELNPRPFAIDPMSAARDMGAIVDAGRILGTGLYPLGVEGLDEAVLAMNHLGQVFAVDPVGEWFLGDSLDAALETLLNGRLPVRVTDDGRWPGRRWTGRGGPAGTGEAAGDPVGLGALKRPVGAGFFLPRSPANLPYTWLPDTLLRIGTVPRAGLDPAQLEVEWGGLPCEAHVLDLPEFTVLVLAFEAVAFQEQQEEVARAGDGPGASPLAQAFRNACTALTPDLEVAFVQTWQPRDLLRLVADQEFAVLTLDSGALVDQGFGLLYLNAPLAENVAPLLGGDRDELPIQGGRLVFAGTGLGRW